MFGPRKVVYFLLIFFSFLALFLFSNHIFAQASCSANPSWKLASVTDGLTSVVYHLKLTNNCSGANNMNLKVIQTPTEPVNLSGWRWKFANGDWNTAYTKPNVSGTVDVNLTVARPSGNIPLGTYRYVVVRATLVSNTASNKISLIYIVEPTPTPLPPTCDRKSPTILVTPDNGTGIGAPGEEIAYTVKLTNNDTNCPDREFDLTAEILNNTNGWTYRLGQTTLIVPSGASKSTKLYVKSPTSSPDGPKTIVVTATTLNGTQYTYNVIYNVVSPELSPTHTPTPTSVITATATPTLSPTPSPTPIRESEETFLSIQIGVDGIGTTPRVPLGGNKNPLHSGRTFLIHVFSAADNTPVFATSHTLDYNSATEKFEGTASLSTDFQTGIYNLYFEGPQFLIKQFPGSATINNGQTKILSPIYVVTGNINNIDQSENKLDILDYQVLISCSIYSQDSGACNEDLNYKDYSDLNDDGTVDEDDYTLWLKEIANQEGDALPPSQ